MSRRSGALTLIELLVSMAIAMLMAGLASGTFLQVRAAMNRSQGRLAMHASAQTLYTHLHRQFLSLQQSCAFVVTTTRSGGSPDLGAVRLIFMHGKEDTQDFDWFAPKLGDSDLVWSQWVWRRERKTLYSAGSQPARDYYSPPAMGFMPGGQDYRSDVKFTGVPQPRRWLDPVQPTNTLDDNIHFPILATLPVDESDARATSLASVDDIGDFTDLQRNLSPTLVQMTDFAVEVVAHDGSVTAYDDGSTITDVRQGVWPDARLTRPDDTAAPGFADSTVAKRPKIIRLRFTLADPGIKLTQTFSFSFALPGMLPPP